MKSKLMRGAVAAVGFVAALASWPFAPIPYAQETSEVARLPPLSYQTSRRLANDPQALRELLARVPKVSTAPVAPLPRAENPPVGWSGLTNPAPAMGMSNPILLTDGSVLLHQVDTVNWYRLTPDPRSSFYNTYINGTWTQIASLASNYGPRFFASAVLPDGRFIIEGGEYNFTNEVHTTLGAIYDPLLDTWTPVTPPSGWGNIGDASGTVLATGEFMLSECCTAQWAYLNPSNLTWELHSGSDKGDQDNNEEGWTLLPDTSLLTVDAYAALGGCPANATGSERFLPRFSGGGDNWISAGSTILQLPDCGPPNKSSEMGPQVLRPDGTVVAFGATTSGVVAHTAIFNSSVGSWAIGPNLPTIGGQNYNLADAPAAILNNGNILFAASPGLFQTPTHFFEVNFSNNTIAQAADTPNASGETAFQVNFLVLPTGQILQTDLSGDIEIYTSGVGNFSPSWRPSVSSVPVNLVEGGTYQLSGSQLSGLSQGAYYGDDAQANTNYPLVLFANDATGDLFYARTFDPSNEAVTPNIAGTVNFTVPQNMEVGPSNLFVVADGIFSLPVAVVVTRSAYAKPADFNADHKSDVLWRFFDGTVAIWEMNGGTILAGLDVQQISNGWQMVGTGDFNGDGLSDILWRYTDGTVAIWEMNGSTILAALTVQQIPNDWTIVGTGDFNGDGKSDILWRNKDGTVVIWEMNGGQIMAVVGNQVVSNDWTIVGTGDFNGDGKSDILWRNKDGTVAIWEMNGGQILSGIVVLQVSNDWQIVGTGDFNADGKSDILWRYKDGTVGIWLMNGGQILSSSVVAQVPNDWTLVQ